MRRAESQRTGTPTDNGRQSSEAESGLQVLAQHSHSSAQTDPNRSLGKPQAWGVDLVRMFMRGNPPASKRATQRDERGQANAKRKGL